jgi:hypothetical protein
MSGIAGKIVAGLMAMGVVLVGISWWQADPATRSAVIDGIGRVLGWTFAVVAVPWALFAFVGWVARKKSNAAGMALVGAITVIEAVALLWLFGWSMPGNAAWSLAVAGVLLAGVYNVFACDFIAEKVE